MSDNGLTLTNAARAAIKAALRATVTAQDMISVSNGARDRLDKAHKSDLIALCALKGLDIAAIAAVADAAAPKPEAAPVTVTADAATDEAATDDAPQTEDAPQAAPEVQADIDAVLSAWRDMDTEGFKAKLQDLAARANKPPVVQTVEIPAAGYSRAPRVQAVRVGETTAKAAFGVSGNKTLGETRLAIWNAPNAPAVDPHYVWPRETGALVSIMFRHRLPVMLVGPAGTGKTTFAQQIAAHLKRPFVRISCTAQTDAPTLVGMTAPAVGGGTEWRDGQLTAAIRTAGAVILIDEPSTARPGALYVLQAVLDSRELYIEETGEVVPVADGVVFVMADNTNGTGDATGQYVASNQMSRATLDRMAATAVIGYLDPATEARVIVAKTGAPQALADLLVTFANMTRQETAKGELPHAIGLRRLMAWSRLLQDGVAATEAAELAFLNTASPDEVEKLRQLLATHASPSLVRDALQNKARAPQAATAFTPVQD